MQPTTFARFESLALARRFLRTTAAVALLFAWTIACGDSSEGGNAGDDDDDDTAGAVDAAPGAGEDGGEPAPPPDASLPAEPPERLWVVPWEADVCPGQRLQLKASAIYAGEEIFDVTPLATWSTDDDSVATVSEGGELLGVATGTVVITAEYRGAADFADIGVVPDEVAGLIIQPASVSVAAGLERDLVAKTVTTCGTTVDVTETATWGSTVPSVAQILAPGRVRGALQGTATVTASAAGFNATAAFDVTKALAKRLDIVPSLVALAPPSCAADPLELDAIVTFTDDTIGNVTGMSMWASNAPEIVSVIGVGEIVGIATGGTEVRATYSADGATVTGIAGATVAGGAPTNLAVTADAPGALSVGASVTMTATGTFPPAIELDLTSAPNITWSSSNAAVATVSNDADDRGRVTGVGAGAATITASWTAGECSLASVPLAVTVVP